MPAIRPLELCRRPGDRGPRQAPRRARRAGAWRWPRPAAAHGGGKGGQRLQEAQPRLRHRRRRAHHRPQPRQPVGPGLRARRRRRGWPTTAPTSRRCTPAACARSIPVTAAARGRHPGRRTDRHGLQPAPAASRSTARRRASSSTPRPGTITAWNSGTTAADRGDDARRDLQGPGHREQGQRDAAVRRELPRGARSTSSIDAFAPVTVPGGFADPNLPAGFAPFNVQEIAGRLVVAYAQQDADAEDEVAGPGLGYVDVFDTSGHLLRRLISQGDAERALGPGARAPALRAVQRRPARRQLRRRGDQRLRPADGRLPRHAA